MNTLVTAIKRNTYLIRSIYTWLLRNRSQKCGLHIGRLTRISKGPYQKNVWLQKTTEKLYFSIASFKNNSLLSNFVIRNLQISLVGCKQAIHGLNQKKELIPPATHLRWIGKSLHLRYCVLTVDRLSCHQYTIISVANHSQQQLLEKNPNRVVVQIHTWIRISIHVGMA